MTTNHYIDYLTGTHPKDPFWSCLFVPLDTLCGHLWPLSTTWRRPRPLWLLGCQCYQRNRSTVHDLVHFCWSEYLDTSLTSQKYDKCQSHCPSHPSCRSFLPLLFLNGFIMISLKGRQAPTSAPRFHTSSSRPSLNLFRPHVLRFNLKLLLHEALSYSCMRPEATSVCGVKVHVYEAWSYLCMRS